MRNDIETYSLQENTQYRALSTVGGQNPVSSAQSVVAGTRNEYIDQNNYFPKPSTFETRSKSIGRGR